MFSRVDFAWRVSEELELTTKTHVLQDGRLSSSVIEMGEERHRMEFEYGVGVWKFGEDVTLLESKDAAFCSKPTQAWS